MENKTIFDAVNSKMAFGIGFLSAILVFGTVGFIILGGCFLKGSCSGFGIADGKGGADVAVADTADDAAVVQPTADEPAAIPIVSSTDHIRGDANAPITIIEYSDFECPYCANFHATMQQVMTDYAGNVRWVYRYFPLSFHENAQSAAEAAECAADQEKFWEYADKLVENHTALGADMYLSIAKELGLNTTTFQSCIDNGDKKAAVTAVYQGGVSAGITGTPGSFIIDTKGSATPIKGALPYETIKTMLDQVLAE